MWEYKGTSFAKEQLDGFQPGGEMIGRGTHVESDFLKAGMAFRERTEEFLCAALKGN